VCPSPYPLRSRLAWESPILSARLLAKLICSSEPLPCSLLLDRIIGPLLGGAGGFIVDNSLHEEPAPPISKHRWPVVAALAVLGIALFTIGAIASGGWALPVVVIGIFLFAIAAGFAGYIGGSRLGGSLRVGVQGFISVFRPVEQNQTVLAPAALAGLLLSDIAKPIVGFVAVYLYGILWFGAVFYCLYRSGIGAFSIATPPGPIRPLSVGIHNWDGNHLGRNMQGLLNWGYWAGHITIPSDGRHWWDFLQFSLMNVVPLGYSELRPDSFVSRALSIMEALASVSWLVIIFSILSGAVNDRLAVRRGQPGGGSGGDGGS